MPLRGLQRMARHLRLCRKYGVLLTQSSARVLSLLRVPQGTPNYLPSLLKQSKIITVIYSNDRMKPGAEH